MSDSKDESVEHSNTSSLVDKYAPYLVFHPDEVCFPITHLEYLEQCKTSTGVPTTSRALYEEYKADRKLQLSFINDQWEVKLRGSSDSAPCYAKIINMDNVIRIVYYYLFSHTTAYKCCGCMCCCSMDKWAHKADLKFLIVELDKVSLEKTRVYFGAHGTQAGQWRNVNEFDEIDEHPIAYAAMGDHSFYYNRGEHARIYWVARDKCADYVSIVAKSTPSIVYDETHPLFDVDKHGWNYVPSSMNVDGVGQPYIQSFWNANVPEKSNNWFLRLFCCNYF
jgi:hypothetical protein